MKVLNQSGGKDFQLYQGDCVEVAKGIPDNSMHYSVSSPPFSSLYTYSNSERDMGNSLNDMQFWAHYKFLIAEKYRMMMPGRLVSVHCMNLPKSKQTHGYIGLSDFRGDIIRAFVNDEAAEFLAVIIRLQKRREKAIGDEPRWNDLDQKIKALERELTDYSEKQGGFIYHSEVCIWKDPVIAMQRTKALGLLHKQIKKDSCMSRQGVPDYLCTFRKPGDNPERVTHTNESFPVQLWQKYASPVWMDIDPGNTLTRAEARDHADERHICALQLEVIQRAIDLWSNPGDVVFSPFAGIGSEGYQALKQGRRFVGIELKESYYKQARLNLISAESSKDHELPLDIPAEPILEAAS